MKVSLATLVLAALAVPASANLVIEPTFQEKMELSDLGGVRGPLTSVGCVDLSGSPELSVTGEAVTYSTPSITGRDHGLTIQPAGGDICVYTGPNVPTRTARYVRFVVDDSNGVLIEKLRGALGYRVTLRGKASPADQVGTGLIVRTEWIRIEGYSGSSRLGHAPIPEKTYRAAARQCHARRVIRMRPGVKNVFSVGGLTDRTGRPSGEGDAQRIECVRRYLGIPSKDVVIVYS